MRIPRIETLIIGIFFACVGVWAASKCSSKREELSERVRRYAEEKDAEREDRPVRRDTVTVKPSTPATGQQPAGATAPQRYSTSAPPQTAPTTVTTTAPAATVSTKSPAATPPATKAAPTTAANRYSTLYVTIDGLKMRRTAGLKGDLVSKLDLYEQVYFLNEKTEWTQEISLGTEKVKDHWVKVRTKSGKEGWVFGAGVHYYKMKRKGVLE
jgi:hypothetical protein